MNSRDEEEGDDREYLAGVVKNAMHGHDHDEKRDAAHVFPGKWLRCKEKRNADAKVGIGSVLELRVGKH